MEQEVTRERHHHVALAEATQAWSAKQPRACKAEWMQLGLSLSRKGDAQQQP